MSAGLDIGSTHALRSSVENQYLKNSDPGYMGGGTITGTNTQPTIEMYENIFGPAGRDIKIDSQRHKRHQRWHLPDALKGHNQFLTDRIDGLITDATNSPFTRNILPYKYLENPDQKLKWNVYSFDEGIASRVPYEAAARVLPQTKKSFAGYTVRQGLAIAMEHNFMMSEAGRANFKHQLTQLVGSIQLTNDLDVHIALLQAPSHQRHMNERYHDQFKTSAQICREYVDMFGIMQKTINALDILIEDAKNTLKTWGAAAPTFLLCNGALTTQLTMTPEATNYLTNGPDGKANLKKGPDLPSYRGLSIINSRKFSMDAGTAPRDLLRRRVRVGEYYHIVWSPRVQQMDFEFYDQSRDTMFRLSYNQLLAMSKLDSDKWSLNGTDMKFDNTVYWQLNNPHNKILSKTPGRPINTEQGGILQHKRPTGKVTSSDEGTDIVNSHELEFTLPSSDEKNGLLFQPIMTWAKGLYGGKMRLEDVRCDLKCSLPSRLCVGQLPHYDVMSEAFGGGIFRHPFENTGVLKSMSTPTTNSKQGLFSPYANLCVPDVVPDVFNFRKPVGRPEAETWGETFSVEVNDAHHYTNHFMRFMNSINCTQYQDCYSNRQNLATDFGTLPLFYDLSGTRVSYAYTDLAALVDAVWRLKLDSGDDSLTNIVEYIKTLTRDQRNEILQQVKDTTLQTRRPGADDIVYGYQSTPGQQLNHALSGMDDLFQEFRQFAEGAGISIGFQDLNYVRDNAADLNSLSSAPFMGDDDDKNRFLNSITTLRKVWSNSVISKWVTCWFNSVDRNTPRFEPSKHPELVNMLLEYETQFPRVLLSEYAYFININSANERFAVSDSEDGLLMAWASSVGSEVARNYKVKKNMHATIAIPAAAQSIGTTSTLLDYDSCAANLCMMFAKQNGNNYSRAHMPMPNLHLATCKPLTSQHASFSASSVNTSMWMIQQVAGMTFLNKDTCETLLKYQSSDAVANATEYQKFLLPDPNNAMHTTAWNSFLMHWFMSYYHPSQTVRTVASNTCNITVHDKQLLCSAIAEAIKLNTCVVEAVNTVLTRLVHPDAFNTKNSRVSSAVALESSNMIPAHYITVQDTQNPCTFRKKRAEDIPVADRDGFNKVEYLPRTASSRQEHLSQTRTACMTRNKFADLSPHNPAHALRDDLSDVPVIVGQSKQIYAYENDVQLTDFENSAFPWMTNNSWIGFLSNPALACNSMPCGVTFKENEEQHNMLRRQPLYDAGDALMRDYVQAAQAACSNPNEHDTVLRHFVMVLFARFFEHSSRFMFDGQGIGVPLSSQKSMFQDQVVRNGLHFMHGPFVATPLSSEESGYGAKDIVILRPNIEHEMLGIIMGRGGTQELGCTFWGQTELSCYDDAQHGIWGMSYKYHERALVTNEKNLIRVFDVSFDGYNGGMDQEAVDWNDFDSLRKFSQATYARDRPYTGPSMLVMALPHNANVTRCNWPNPIVFHDNVDSDPTPDPQKDHKLPSVKEYMVFNSSECPRLCSKAQETAYKAYMDRLGMHQWSSIDASSRPAGELCVANEASTHMLAFQGTMKSYDANGALVEHIQGSGHLGPSYVGVASIREGRGLQNTHMAPQMIRQI